MTDRITKPITAMKEYGRKPYLVTKDAVPYGEKADYRYMMDTAWHKAQDNEYIVVQSVKKKPYQNSDYQAMEQGYDFPIFTFPQWNLQFDFPEPIYTQNPIPPPPQIPEPPPPSPSPSPSGKTGFFLRVYTYNPYTWLDDIIINNPDPFHPNSITNVGSLVSNSLATHDSGFPPDGNGTFTTWITIEGVTACTYYAEMVDYAFVGNWEYVGAGLYSGWINGNNYFINYSIESYAGTKRFLQGVNKGESFKVERTTSPYTYPDFKYGVGK